MEGRNHCFLQFENSVEVDYRLGFLSLRASHPIWGDCRRYCLGEDALWLGVQPLGMECRQLVVAVGYSAGGVARMVAVKD